MIFVVQGGNSEQFACYAKSYFLPITMITIYLYDGMVFFFSVGRTTPNKRPIGVCTKNVVLKARYLSFPVR